MDKDMADDISGDKGIEKDNAREDKNKTTTITENDDDMKKPMSGDTKKSHVSSDPKINQVNEEDGQIQHHKKVQDIQKAVPSIHEKTTNKENKGKRKKLPKRNPKCFSSPTLLS